jgi:hypothetical protein
MSNPVASGSSAIIREYHVARLWRCTLTEAYQYTSFGKDDLPELVGDLGGRV